MKNLLYKEFKLSTNVQTIIFTILACLVIIPSWPSLISFMYPLIAIITIFPISSANQDPLYTSFLPIKKKDIVKARILYIMCIEIIAILISIPFALIRKYLLSSIILNDLGINLALYGIVLFIYTIFNLILIPWVYKKIDKTALPTTISTIVIMFLIILIMMVFILIPQATFFINDYSTLPSLLTQISVLILGILLFISSYFLIYKLAGNNFLKTDL